MKGCVYCVDCGREKTALLVHDLLKLLSIFIRERHLDAVGQLLTSDFWCGCLQLERTLFLARKNQLCLSRIHLRLLGEAIDHVGARGCCLHKAVERWLFDLVEPVLDVCEHAFHVQHRPLEHLALGRVATSNVCRRLVLASEAVCETFFGATHKTFLAHTHIRVGGGDKGRPALLSAVVSAPC